MIMIRVRISKPKLAVSLLRYVIYIPDAVISRDNLNSADKKKAKQPPVYTDAQSELISIPENLLRTLDHLV